MFWILTSPSRQEAVAILSEVQSHDGAPPLPFSERAFSIPGAAYEPRHRSGARSGCLDLPKQRMTMHGFRAMARAILDEVLEFRPDFIEHQLARSSGIPTVGPTIGRCPCPSGACRCRLWAQTIWADDLDRQRAGEIEPGPRKVPGLAHSPTQRGDADLEPVGFR